MNLQIFPNWCKKVGVTIFILGLLLFIFLFINAIITSTQGNSAYESGYLLGKQLRSSLDTEIFWSITIGKITNLFTMIGMIMFFLSKEKIEDEYINKLRLEAYQFTSLFIAFLLFFISILGKNISASFLLYIFFACYLLVFRIKKESI